MNIETKATNLDEQIPQHRHNATEIEMPPSIEQPDFKRANLTTDSVYAWTRSDFLAQEAEVRAILQSNDAAAAVDKAEKLQRQSLRSGDAAYLEAPLDIASSYLLLGQSLRQYGAAQLALQPLSEAQRRFAILTTWGGSEAAQFQIRAISLQGKCLRDLGRLPEAATAFEQAIHYASHSRLEAATAINLVELATTYLQMGHFGDALNEYQDALALIRKLNDTEMMVAILQQMGIAYTELAQFNRAEKAFVEAWKLCEERQDRVRAADTLTELGNLWNVQGGLQEAINFYEQAALAYVELGDAPREGVIRSNMADALIKLERFDDAKRALSRAVECEAPQGHAAEPWKTWNILRRLHEATGHPQESTEAYDRALDSYTAYRQAGGASQSAWAPVCTLAVDAILSNTKEEAHGVIADLLRRSDLLPADQACIATLAKIIDGERDIDLAHNPQLSYLDSAELLLLLESLSR